MARTMNLNNYVKCDEGEATLKIVPFKLKDGTQPPAINLKHKGTTKGLKFKDITKDTVWEAGIKFDITQDTSDYKSCVYWWTKNATTEFKEALLEEYSGLFSAEELSRKIKSLKNWLTENAGYKNKNGKYTKRKIKFNQFIRTCLNKDSTFKFGG